MSLTVSKSPLKLCTNAHKLYPLYTNIIITRGKRFLQKLISSRDGLVKSTKIRQGRKKHAKTTLWNTGRKESQKTTLHPLHICSTCMQQMYSSLLFIPALFLSILQTHLYLKGSWLKLFTPVSVVFRRRVEAQKLTMNKTLIILCPLKLSDSSVQIIITTLLLLNYHFSTKKTLFLTRTMFYI